jgi:hypothetical protein
LAFTPLSTYRHSSSFPRSLDRASWFSPVCVSGKGDIPPRAARARAPLKCRRGPICREAPEYRWMNAGENDSGWMSALAPPARFPASPNRASSCSPAVYSAASGADSGGASNATRIRRIRDVPSEGRAWGGQTRLAGHSHTVLHASQSIVRIRNLPRSCELRDAFAPEWGRRDAGSRETGGLRWTTAEDLAF